MSIGRRVAVAVVVIAVATATPSVRDLCRNAEYVYNIETVKYVLYVVLLD